MASASGSTAFRVVRLAGGRPGSLGFRPHPPPPPPALLVPDHTVSICHPQNFLSTPRSSSLGPVSVSPPLLYRCSACAPDCGEEQ